MMMKVDFASIRYVGANPKGLYVTWVVNWLIKPFTMFAIAAFFFFVVFKSLIPHDLAKDYLAGAILLGAAPCTAMVFVWSHLTRGNAAYTVVQVATNDLIILVAFTPIVALLLGVSGVTIPWGTLLLSVLLFVVIPLVAGIATRAAVIKRDGLDYFNNTFLARFSNVTIVGLLLTLVLIFSFQGRVILDNPLHILLIAVPLVIQTVLIFFIAYLACQKMQCPHNIAAPAGMIGASNFFELAVAVAITLFGPSSPVVSWWKCRWCWPWLPSPIGPWGGFRSQRTPSRSIRRRRLRFESGRLRRNRTNFFSRGLTPRASAHGSDRTVTHNVNELRSPA
jgi:ACR3 family arsenite transporter